MKALKLEKQTVCSPEQSHTHSRTRKEALVGRILRSDEEVQQMVRQWLHLQP